MDTYFRISESSKDWLDIPLEAFAIRSLLGSISPRSVCAGFLVALTRVVIVCRTARKQLVG